MLAKQSNVGAPQGKHVHIEVRNGVKTSAAKSVGDSKLDNLDPYPYWQQLYETKSQIISSSSGTISISATVPEKLPVGINYSLTGTASLIGGKFASTFQQFIRISVLNSRNVEIWNKLIPFNNKTAVSLNCDINSSSFSEGTYIIRFSRQGLDGLISKPIYQSSFTIGSSTTTTSVSGIKATYSAPNVIYTGSSNSSYPIGIYQIKVNTRLNIRQSPSTSSAILGKLYNGDRVNVTATNGVWGFIGNGWISLNYATRVADIPAEVYNVVNYETGVYRVTSATLNGREKPTENSTRILQLNNGEEFSVEQVDGSWGYCPKYKAWFCLNYAERIGDLQPEVPVPAMPILNTDSSSHIAVGDIINLTWNAAANAESYTLSLINHDTGAVVNTISKTTNTKASFTVPSAGTYDVSIYAENAKHKSSTSKLYGITAHAPSTVTFKDWDGKILATQQVAYEKDAKLPTNPSRVGHTFTSWSGDYKFVTENRTITAQYKRNSYTVTFYDQDGKTIVDQQSVLYEDAAKAPSYTAPTGYTFIKWDKDFSKITENISIKAVNNWTSAYPLEISTTSSIYRNGTAYVTTAIVNNSPNAVTNAKVIVALKTADDKLLATAKSSNLSLAAGEIKNITLTATYDGAATVGNLFVVKANDENIPLAKQLNVTVDQGTAWSGWSTSTPPSDALKTESRTEYQYRTKQYTTSSSSTMSGWTQYNHTYTWGNWGGWSAWQDAKVDAITSENVEQQRQVQTRQVTDYNNFTAWGAWSDWQDAWVGGSDLRQVETRTVEDPNSPIYTTEYHYCRYANSSGSTGSDAYIPSKGWTNFEEIVLSSPLTQVSSTKGNTGYTGYMYNGHTYWPTEVVGAACQRQVIVGYNQKTQYRYRDRNYATKTQYQYRTRNKQHTYYFWKWSDWSAWSTTSQTASSDKGVNTRTTYRYISNNPKNIEDTTGQARTIKGFVDSEFIGKQAILHIYSADGTTQYLGQTEIESGLTEIPSGAYELTFKLKDEPTAESGDYYVTLSIEGTTTAIALDSIIAPVPEYTVTFKNYDGSILQTQTVKKGKNATMPESPIRTGYDFIGWDSTGTNVQKDTTITAQFEIKSFDVVFVDDVAGTRTTKTFKYGDELVTPDVEDREEYDFVGWNAVLNGIKEVTENLVVMAQYNLKAYDVTFLDYEGNVVQSTKVYYADGVTPPILDSNEKYIFIAWDTSADLDYITSDLTISPICEYAETVATPEISLFTGSYDSEQTVVLACETEGAQIYYTTDGSDPLEEKASVSTYSAKAKAATSQINGTLYTEPFTLDSSANLVVVAVKDGMNSSWYEDATYAINTDATTERKHLVTVHDGLYDYDYSYLVDENALAVDENYEFKQFGYKLMGVYTDEEMTKSWNLNSDRVTNSLDIYLKWEKETYNVKFIDKNGNTISEQQVAYLSSADAPNIPEVDDYIFSGWDNDYTTIYEDTVVKATYIAKEDVTTVTLSNSSVELKPKQSIDLVAAVSLGKNSTNNHIIWQSSDENVAVVDDCGHVTAVADGKATIFAVSEDSGDVAICEISIYSNCKHTFTELFTEPTCTEDGYIIYKCSECDYLYTETVIPAIGHIDNDSDGYCDTCKTDLGTHAPDDPTVNCSCNCHKTGIVKFFWKIINFFHKIFGMKQYQYCDCGTKHW